MDWEQCIIKEFRPCILAAKTQDADTPDWDTAMNGPDQDGYWEAPKKEIATLEIKNTLDVVDC